jgi:hypothetical protein
VRVLNARLDHQPIPVQHIATDGTLTMVTSSLAYGDIVEVEVQGNASHIGLGSPTVPSLLLEVPVGFDARLTGSAADHAMFISVDDDRFGSTVFSIRPAQL